MHLPSFLSLLGVSLRLPCVPFRGDLSHFSHRRKQQQQRPRHKSVPSIATGARERPHARGGDGGHRSTGELEVHRVSPASLPSMIPDPRTARWTEDRKTDS